MNYYKKKLSVNPLIYWTIGGVVVVFLIVFAIFSLTRAKPTKGDGDVTPAKVAVVQTTPTIRQDTGNSASPVTQAQAAVQPAGSTKAPSAISTPSEGEIFLATHPESIDFEINRDEVNSDGIFISIDDVIALTNIPFHNAILSADVYAQQCRDYQQAGFSSNVHVNATLAIKAYISAEELPIYEFLMNGIGADDSDSVVQAKILANTQALWDKFREPGLPRYEVGENETKNIFIVPFDLHQEIVKLCK